MCGNEAGEAPEEEGAEKDIADVAEGGGGRLEKREGAITKRDGIHAGEKEEVSEFACDGDVGQWCGGEGTKLGEGVKGKGEEPHVGPGGKMKEEEHELLLFLYLQKLL